jgi:retinol dehydrogenase 13
MPGGFLSKYLKEYKWSNIFAMIRNLQSKPDRCSDDCNQRLVVITGATSGIGYTVARKFASRGADLLLINRNEQKSKELCETLKNEYNTNSTYLIADFLRLSNIRSAAQQLAVLDRDIDVLVHNAGVYNTNRIITEDNLEAVFQTNYLSTFILNYVLREKLKKQQRGRILFVNSEAYRFAAFGLHMDDLSWKEHHYSGLQSYGAAKLAQLLSMMKFDEYFKGSTITINAMHPGNVKTNSGQNNGKIYKYLKKILIDKSAQPLELSAEAIYYLCVSSDLEKKSNRFFNLTTDEELAPPALDRMAAEKLWEISLQMSGLYE